MSHDQHPAPRTHTVRASSGGGKWKWAAGAAAIAVILAGGYYAISQSDPNQNEQFAYNNEMSAADDTFDTAMAPSDEPATIDEEPAERAAPAAATERPARSTPAPRNQTAAAEPASDPVPLQVVGVSSDGEIASSEEEVVIPGRVRPEWTRTPSEYRLTTAYPERALQRGREGEAQVNCTVIENGALDCVQASEYPANSGFGNAALRVARMFRHAPQRADGTSAVGDPVNLRVVFRLADEDRRRG